MTWLDQYRIDNPLLLPPLSLAYVGDAVFELFVRQRVLMLSGGVKAGTLHKAAMSYVRATVQARALADLHPALTEQEQDVVRRGRNAKGHAAPKSADRAEYAASTAFEALVGYLFLSGREERLREVLATVARYVEHS